MENNDNFATTQWSVVRRASADDSGVAQSALQQLCQSYWYPLYAFVRYRGHQAAEAEDLTQAFFADLLKRDGINNLAPDAGRFRSFLLASLKNFLNNEWDKKQTQKRGGGRAHVSIDFSEADRKIELADDDGSNPEAAFERQWALALIERVQKMLGREFENRGRSHVFSRLQPFLVGKNVEETMASVAAELEMSEVAVKVAVHRMRTRFGQLLQQEIRSTVDKEEDVEDEISRLFEALKG